MKNNTNRLTAQRMNALNVFRWCEAENSMDHFFFVYGTFAVCGTIIALFPQTFYRSLFFFCLSSSSTLLERENPKKIASSVYGNTASSAKRNICLILSRIGIRMPAIEQRATKSKSNVKRRFITGKSPNHAMHRS